jgi:dihydroflavonol-4-reductase
LIQKFEIVAVIHTEEKRMKVFLTGGTGFIGQSLTQALLRRGLSVTALVRKPDSLRAQALQKMGVELAPGDVSNRASMRAAITGADIVVHNAGVYEYGINNAGKQRIRSVNVDGTENVLGLAQELGISRTIYVSSIQAFGETGRQLRDETFTRQFPCRTVYEQSKTDAHKIALQYQQRGLPLIIVCPHAVIGVNDQSGFGYLLRFFVNRVLPPVSVSPGSISACVEVHDLAEGIALAVEKGRIGETYFFCGEALSFREIYDLWSKKPGAYTPKIWLPTGLASVLFAPLEPLQQALGLAAVFSRESARAATTNWNYSSEKAKHELGWSHRSAEEMWYAAIDGEIHILSKRKDQSLLQRLKPMEIAD